MDAFYGQREAREIRRVRPFRESGGPGVRGVGTRGEAAAAVGTQAPAMWARSWPRAGGLASERRLAE
jgi:hypothetical protein